MAYADPQSTHNPTTGQVIPASWGDIVRDDLEYLARNKPHAKATRTSTQSINTATWTAVSLTSEDFDVGGMHSTASNQSRLTIPTGEDGKYVFTGDAKFASNATGTLRAARLVKNGTTVIAHTQGMASGSYLAYMNVSTGPIALVATDYIELFVFQDSGGALNTSVTDGNTFLTGMWVAV